MIVGYILLLIVAVSPIIYRQNKRIRLLEEQVALLNEKINTK